MKTNGKLYFFEVLGVYLILTLYYFIAEHSSWFIAMPAFFAGLATLAHSRQGGWAIPVALLLSSVGDYQGSEHNFILQILFFALAHIFYIADFLPKRKVLKKNNYIVASLPYIYVLAFLVLLIPRMNHVAEIVAVAIYAMIIATMGASALTLDIKHKWWYVVAAVLFIFSDSVIVYNKYIEHVPNASLWIMTTYYAAQGLFATLCLLRRKE